MNRKLNLILFLTVFFSSFLSASAQEKPSSTAAIITREQYFAAVRKASDQTEKYKHRIKFTTTNDAPEKNNKRILLYEFISPRHDRSVFEYYGEDDRLVRFEEMTVGNARYVKYDSQDWRRKTEPDVLGVYGRGSELTIEYLRLGRELVNNRTADVYQKTETSRYPSLPNSQATVEIEKYWIDEKGLIVKYSFSTTDQSLGRLLNKIKDYEYDPNLKISPPPTKTPQRKKISKRKR
jgi:outer membrane lipoprotein-sorting protein